MKFTLRNATMADAKELLRWKNDPTTRKFAIVTQKRITLKDHLVWLEKTLRDSHVNLFIITDGLNDYGDVRLDVGPLETEISVRIAPEHRLHGVATRALKLAIKEYFETDTNSLIAKVVDGNIASMRTFLKLGFVPYKHEKNFYFLERGR